jgi:hypothetical protein
MLSRNKKNLYTLDGGHKFELVKEKKGSRSSPIQNRGRREEEEEGN